MKKYDIKNVIHIENDVLLFYNPDILLNFIDRKYIYIPFMSVTFNICSIMYIPDHHTYTKALEHFNFEKCDMLNFRNISEKTGIIQNFPIFISIDDENPQISFVSQNFEKFNFIFDAAAIGQYLGPFYPNVDKNSFINPVINGHCVIKYNNYDFYFENGFDNVKRPFIVINNNNYPIFNLHIHCKALKKFLL